MVADDSGASMRYRLLETVRQYSLEKLAASGEADGVRNRHRDYYQAVATRLQSESHAAMERHTPGLRSRWTISGPRMRGEPRKRRIRDGTRTGIRAAAALAERGDSARAPWKEAVFSDERYRDEQLTPAVRVAAVADASQLAVWPAAPASLERAVRATDRRRRDRGRCADSAGNDGMRNAQLGSA